MIKEKITVFVGANMTKAKKNLLAIGNEHIRSLPLQCKSSLRAQMPFTLFEKNILCDRTLKEKKSYC